MQGLNELTEYPPNSAFTGTADAAATSGCTKEQMAHINLCLVRHAYNNYLSNIVVNVACGLGLYAQFYISGENTSLVTTLIVGLLVLSLGRVLAGRADSRRLEAPEVPPSDVARGARRYFLGMTAGVALWSALLHLALQSEHSDLKYFAIIVVSAMASGATGVIAPLLKSGRFYISALLAMVLVELQIQPDPQHVLSFLVVTFWGVMLVTHSRNHNILRNSIQLQMLNRSLVDDLRVQQEALTEFNATLEDRVKRRTSDLKRLAERDSLTQLYNRRGIIQWVEDQRHRIPEGHAFAVIFIDLDRFKQINDGMGHATGDCTLAEIGERLAEAAPDLCAFCRWGAMNLSGFWLRRRIAAPISAMSSPPSCAPSCRNRSS